MPWLLLTLLLGCFGDRVQCDSPEQIVAEADGETLSCEQAELAVRWVELLAGRPIPKQRQMALAGVRARFSDDPGGTLIWLDGLEQRRQQIRVKTGFDGAEARSNAVWLHTRERGLITPSDGHLWEAADKALAVWNTHDEDELALTEADIETWVLYGSLCRQMQGAGVLRISVADRVQVYATIADRWNFGSRTERVALTSLGPYWAHARDRFNGASYETQREWATTAPLPPAMTATSLGYLQAILEGDLIGHAAAVHGKLGPLAMGR